MTNTMTREQRLNLVASLRAQAAEQERFADALIRRDAPRADVQRHQARADQLTACANEHELLADGPHRVKLHLHIDLEVDPAAWRLIYGVGLDALPNDVQTYVTTLLLSCAAAEEDGITNAQVAVLQMKELGR